MAPARSGVAGFYWERVCFLSLAIPVFYTALCKPAFYDYLTYWTLCLHAFYFSLDKSSAHAHGLIRLVHPIALFGGLAVLFGYSVLALVGSAYHGSFEDWNLAVHSRDAAPPANPRMLKAYEHAWPIVAHVVDARCNRASLRACYAGRTRSAVLALGGALYLAFGLVWEAVTMSGEEQSTLKIYAQPPELSTRNVLGYFGLEAHADGFKEDFVFSTAQKVLLLALSSLTFAWGVKPLFAPQGAPKGKRAKRA